VADLFAKKMGDVWMRGFATALASMWRLHHDPQMVHAVLRHNGLTVEDLRAAGVDEYDLAVFARCVACCECVAHLERMVAEGASRTSSVRCGQRREVLVAEDREIIRRIGAFALEVRELVAGQAELTAELFDRKAQLFADMADDGERFPGLAFLVEECRAIAADARARAAELRAAKGGPDA
jgi:hypothetical protein